MMSQPQVLQSTEELLFGAPLYKMYALPDDLTIVKQLYGRGIEKYKFDAHCPFCRKQTTWTVGGISIPNGDPWNNIKERFSYDQMHVTCGRSGNHLVRFYFRVNKMTIEKVGQYPSLATISNDEVSAYRKTMDPADAQEFHKAIGLASHGVGVGSFVYLRRVFERLIYSRYAEFKEAEGWNDDEFFKLAMSDKVKYLKAHLPSFLVENAKIYSILSVGIHELDEETCLGYFDVLKHSIIIILDEDKKKREELAMRTKFAAALSKINP